MIRLLSGLPANVVGAEAVGRIVVEDYAGVLEPAVAAALEGHEKIRLLYVLGEEFEGYAPGAGWEDAKLGVGHWGSWERIALVTDKRWVADGVKALSWMFPGEVRVGGTDQRAEAVAWITA